MTFKLLPSLITKPVAPVVESELPEEQPQKNTEHIEVIDCEQINGPEDVAEEDSVTIIEYKFNVHVEYHHPSLENPLLIVASATLKGDYSVEDDSFSAPYGSTTAHGGGVYGVYDQFEWTDIQIPQIEDNMDVYTLSPEKSQHVIQYVVQSMSKMNHDAIDKLVSGEDLLMEIEEKYKRARANDYEPPEPDFD